MKLGKKPQQQQDAAEHRLQILAFELMSAGAQVLRDQYGFDEEEIKRWMDLTVAVAQASRKVTSKPGE